MTLELAYIVIGFLGTAIIGLVVYIWNRKDASDVKPEAHATLQSNVAYLLREVGEDSHSGLRGEKHKHANWLQRHEGRLDDLDRWRQRSGNGGQK